MFHIIISRGAKLDSLLEESQLTFLNYFFIIILWGFFLLYSLFRGQYNFCTLLH